MANYIVAYDISEQSKQEGRDQAVRDSLERNHARHVQLSVWLLKSASTASQIYGVIARHLIMTRDYLLVAEYNPDDIKRGGPPVP